MDPVRRRPVALPPSGECCRSDDTQSSVPPRFTDGNGVAHSRLSDVPGEGAAVMPRCSWAGGQKSSYNARHAGVAQLVERRLPKPEVASSRLVARSTFHHRRYYLVGGHGVQVHGQHPKVRSRRHPGRFPAAAARAFQRQAPVSSHPVSLATPACSAASRVAAIVCGLFLLPVSLLPVSTRQHRQDLHHFGSLCGIRTTFKARAGP